MRRGAGLALLAMALLLAPTASAWRNPANAPRLLEKPIEDYRYDHAHGCRTSPTRGIKQLTAWIDRHYPGEFWGWMRCSKLSRDSWSLHSDGRALDWRLDAGIRRERLAARALIARLLAADRDGNGHALARRMGVQEIIFNCRYWASGPGGMRRYDPCDEKGIDRTSAHRDHVHIGINWAGAKLRTSFWRRGLAAR